MSGCMAGDKPLISIVLAVYHPRMDWLIEQLDSLNAQTYPNLELIVCDDGPDEPVEEQVFAGHITAFSWELVRNEENLGSNKTFERLTAMARGEYIAYCDQDDVWLPEKLEKLAATISDGTMAYCDTSVIDAAGEMIANSLRVIRPRLRYLDGDHLVNLYTFRNCTPGCTILLLKKVAMKAIPFPTTTVCDQWLCMTAAYFGVIRFVQRPLVRYRQHNENQTGILHGVTTKQDYYRSRLIPLLDRTLLFQEKFALSPEIVEFVKARVKKDIFSIWKYRCLCKNEALFEIATKWMPEWLFQKVIQKVKGD